MPKVSVIIPTHNSSNYICDAIDSVLQQCYKDYEIIVVDDGSTDNTKEALRQYGQKIKYIYQENKGVSAARNTGIKEANGKYIALLDADDTWVPNKLSRQIEILENNKEIGLTCSLMDTMSEQGVSLNKIKPKKPLARTFEKALIFGSPPPSTFVIRREYLDAVGLFGEEIDIFEDLDLFLKISKKYSIAPMNEVLGRYRIHSSNITRNDERVYRNQIIIAKKWLPHCLTKRTKILLVRRIKKYSSLMARRNLKKWDIVSSLRYLLIYTSGATKDLLCV